DQLALAAADGNHRVDCFEAGLQRLLHGPAVDDPRRIALDRPELLGVDRALAVDGLAEGVDDAPDQRFAHPHLGDAPGPLDHVPLADGAVLAEEDGPDVVLLQVEHHPDNVLRKGEQLPGHRPFEPVHAGDAVSHLDHATDLGEVGLALELLDLPPDDLADLAGLDPAAPPAPWRRRPGRAPNRPATLTPKPRLPAAATKPPSSAGSTSVSNKTVLPRRRPSRSRKVARSTSPSGAALRTRARMRPAA